MKYNTKTKSAVTSYKTKTNKSAMPKQPCTKRTAATISAKR